MSINLNDLVFLGFRFSSTFFKLSFTTNSSLIISYVTIPSFGFFQLNHLIKIKKH